MARKTKVDYNVYEKWYDRYAATVEMKDAKMDEREFMNLYYNARYAKINMKDFSRRVAMRQRQASELQLRATWGGFKKTLQETKKNIRQYEKEKLNEVIAEEITAYRKKEHLRKLGKRQIEAEIKRWKKKGISEKIREEVKFRVADDMQEEMTFIANYKDVTWKEFRKAQKAITKAGRAISGSREIWDEAFALAFRSPKESA